MSTEHEKQWVIWTEKWEETTWVEAQIDDTKWGVFNFLSTYWQLFAFLAVISPFWMQGVNYAFKLGSWFGMQEIPMNTRAKMVCNGKELYIKRNENQIVCYIADDKGKKSTLESGWITLPEVTIKWWEILRERTIGKWKIYEIDNWWDREISVINSRGSVVFSWKYREYLLKLNIWK